MSFCACSRFSFTSVNSFTLVGLLILSSIRPKPSGCALPVAAGGALLIFLELSSLSYSCGSSYFCCFWAINSSKSSDFSSFSLSIWSSLYSFLEICLSSFSSFYIYMLWNHLTLKASSVCSFCDCKNFSICPSVISEFLTWYISASDKSITFVAIALHNIS